MRYFVAGNFWLFVSLVVFLSQKAERVAPTRVSFLGLGSWFRPATYNAVVLLCLAVAIAFFCLSRRKEEEGTQ